MCPANWQVFIELNLSWFVLGQVVACAAEAESVGLHGGAFDVADVDWKIKRILLRFERPEQSEDVTHFVRAQRAFRVLDFEDSEVMVLLVELL